MTDPEAFLGATPGTVSSTRDAAAEGVPGDKGTGADMRTAPGLPDDWTIPVEHLSASSLNMLAICPRQFQQRYILHRKEAPSQAQVVGNSFHSTMEYNYRQKMVSHEDLPIEDVMDYYHDHAWPETVKSATAEGEIKWKQEKDAKLTGALMSTAYRRDIAPTIQPLEVEYSFSTSIAKVPVPLVGRIDVIDAETIIDLKSSSRKVYKMKPGWRQQGRIYQLVTPRNMDFHVVTNKGENLVGDFQIRYSFAAWLATERWVNSMAWLANYYWTTYGVEDEWPTTGTAHDWRCDWCAYKPGCPAWK